jgi:GNAT superfamily N-acetyltransferase
MITETKIMITGINIFVRKLRGRGKFLRRCIDILTDYFWIRSLGFWEYDLTRTDAAWLKFRNENQLIRWRLATAEDCQDWSESGADGFSKEDCELLIQLLKSPEHFVLVGYKFRSKNENDNENKIETIPDCYAVCVTGKKPMTHRISFQMESNEGTIRTVYTRQGSRGQGFATQLYAEICCIAQEKGFNKLYVDIDTSNFASIRAAEKAGGILVPKMFFFELRFFKHSFGFVAGNYQNKFCKR